MTDDTTKLTRLRARVKRLEDALVHIEEYWNGAENTRAMSDALNEMVKAARAALGPAMTERDEMIEWLHRKENELTVVLWKSEARKIIAALEARGWTTVMLTRVGGGSPEDLLAIDLLIHTDGLILDEGTAGVIARGFGTSRELWLNLDRQLRSPTPPASQRVPHEQN
jgi:ATPase subunit of ABC transporter with duplicated ATPase domains